MSRQYFFQTSQTFQEVFDDKRNEKVLAKRFNEHITIILETNLEETLDSNFSF